MLSSGKIYGAFLLLQVLLWPAIGWAAGFDAGALKESREGIELSIEQQPLGEVLKAINEKSGIKFSYPDDLTETPLSADIKSKDWQSLVQTLLNGFSKMEFWSESPETSRIKIIGLGEYVPVETPRRASQPKVIAPSNTDRATGVDPRSSRRRSAPKKEVEEDPNHPINKLPPHIFMEPGILNYLIAKKVDIPDSVKQRYGLEEDRLPPNYPIPPHIMHDPALKEYLDSVGLPLPPQFPGQP